MRTACTDRIPHRPSSCSNSTNGLGIDGIAGDTTLDLIYSNKAHRYTIKQGDSGSDVAALQRRLKELKYFSGSANGYFGAATTTALKAFQKRNSLTADGKAGSGTRDLIYSSKAKKAATSSSSSNTGSSNTGSSNPGSSNTGSSTTTSGSKSVSKFLDFAQAQLGKRYVSGNEGPSSFDCSGFVYYCLKNNGVNIGRLSAKGFSQVDDWTSIKKADLRAGDILFFGLRGSASVGHTGIYLGGGKMIHCSSSKGAKSSSPTCPEAIGLKTTNPPSGFTKKTSKGPFRASKGAFLSFSCYSSNPPVTSTMAPAI